MSQMNNQNTLAHYLDDIWLTKPRKLIKPGELQGIIVCVEKDGEFYAVDYLQLSSDGIYQRKNNQLGTLEDDAFKKYIEQLTGPSSMPEEELFDRVASIYQQTGSMKPAVKEFGLSKERVRRILITRGLYTNDFISKVAWLYDGGKGKSVADIAEMLGVTVGPNRVEYDAKRVVGVYRQEPQPQLKAELSKPQKPSALTTGIRIGSLLYIGTERVIGG